MNNTIYISDADLELLDYTRIGLIWIIENIQYRLVEATAKGYHFIKIKEV